MENVVLSNSILFLQIYCQILYTEMSYLDYKIGNIFHASTNAIILSSH